MDYTITRTDPANGSFIIKPYTANGPLTPTSSSLYPGAVSANTSLILMGKGEVDYGEPSAKNLVHILENFAGPTAPLYAVQGQLWFNNTTSSLHLFTNNTGAHTEVVVSGQLSADFNANGKKVTNVANATVNTDAVNLQTADGRYLRLIGGNVTGNIVMSGATITGLPSVPAGTSDAASKAYVDSAIVGASGVASFNTRTGAITLNALDVTNALVYTPYDATNPAGYLTAATLTGVEVTTALGYTPYNATNPTGYITAASAPVSSFNTRTTGAITLNALDVTTALTYTPFDGATTPTVTGGYLSGTTLTLFIPTGSVSISNVSPSVHTHIPDEVILNGNPFGYNSRVRDQTITSPGYPRVPLTNALAYFDQDLYSLMGRKRRTLFAVSAGYTVGAFTTGASNYWQITGADYTTEFVAGYKIQIDGNANGPTNTTYTIVSSVFTGGNTVITVTASTIPVATTVSGTVRALTYALDLDSQYTVEHNDLVVHKDGLKLYASQRGNAYVSLPGVTSGSWCGLLNGSYGFTLATDGGVGVGLSVNVAQLTYAVVNVAPGGNTWTVSGNHYTEFTLHQKLVIHGNVGIGATTYTVYDVVSAVYNAPNTVITVSQTIVGGATANGTLDNALLFTQLEPLVSFALFAAGVRATFDADTTYLQFLPIPVTAAYMQFFSNTVGTGSQIVYTSGTLDTTIATNLAITPVITNRPAVAANLGYKEVGNPFTYSNLVELNPTVATGTSIECICTV